jgi:hypothetical protein
MVGATLLRGFFDCPVDRLLPLSEELLRSALDDEGLLVGVAAPADLEEVLTCENGQFSLNARGKEESRRDEPLRWLTWVAPVMLLTKMRPFN